MTETIRVFIGTDPSQLGAAEVLRQSILEKSSLPVDIKTMENLRIPEPKDARQSQRTGFSFARWAIPELCNYNGKAIYIDADMFVFADIKELWEMPMNGATVNIVDGRDTSYCSDKAKGNKNETSVMLIDCSKADWSLQSLVDGLDGKYSYAGMMTDLCFIPEEKIQRGIPRCWNAMDYWDSSVCLLHYTNVPSQPWVATFNSYGYVWVDQVKRLIKEQKIALDYMIAQIRHEYFRPSLLAELEGETNHGSNETYTEALNEIDRAAGFIPHRALMEYARKRERAIRTYELGRAKQEDFASFIKLTANYAVSDLKDIARKVLRRA